MKDTHDNLFLLNRLYALQADVADLRRAFDDLPSDLLGIPVFCRAGIALVSKGLESAISVVRARFGDTDAQRLAEVIAHEHVFLDVRNIRAPVPPGPPSHTVFMAAVCRCGAVQVFPRSNYDLTTDEFRRTFESSLAAEGRFLDWGEKDDPGPDRRPGGDGEAGTGHSG
jgi:hypothetical protein